MTTQNVFALFEEDSVIADLKNIKCHLLMLIIEIVRERGLSQSEVATLTGITAPRISNLMKGYLHKFSIDMLLNISLKLKAQADVSYNPVDKTLNIQLLG